MKNKKAGVNFFLILLLLAVLFFVIMVTPLRSMIFGIRDVGNQTTSCTAFGFTGQKGVCKFSSECDADYVNIGCPKKDDKEQVCCFEERTDDETNGDSDDETEWELTYENCQKVNWKDPCKVSVTGLTLKPAEVSPEGTFIITCETNVKAPDCIEMSSPSPLISISSYREWSTSGDGKPILQMRAKASQTKSQFYIYCSVDKTKCDVGDSERKLAILTVK